MANKSDFRGLLFFNLKVNFAKEKMKKKFSEFVKFFSSQIFLLQVLRREKKRKFYPFKVFYFNHVSNQIDEVSPRWLSKQRI